MIEVVSVGKLQVEVRRSERRRTVGLTVERDGSLVAVAPSSMDFANLTRFVRSKELWLHSALLKKESISPAAATKRFVSGEGFYYLGRSYRLRITDEAAAPPLRFSQSRFFLHRKHAADARDMFIGWYTQRMTDWLSEKLPLLQERIGVEAQQTVVMDLGYRWASCSGTGRLNFHWRMILLPPAMINYLVLHELCHIQEHNHTERFWALVRRVDYDFERKEDWLRTNGAIYTL